MCKSSLHNFLVDLPKVEQHMHLEGSLEPDLLFELAKRNNIPLPDTSDFASVDSLLARYRRFTGLDDFLKYYFIGMKTLLTSSDFEDLAYRYFKKAHSQNVIHAEVFFDPQEHMKDKSRGIEFETILNGFKSAQRRAVEDFGLTSELIVCMLRHFTPDECHDSYLLAQPYIYRGDIAGLGLSSTEKDKHPTLYQQSYDQAVLWGLRVTAHAGEEGDVSYMRSAVDDLGCTRIDHGIKLRDDPELLARFAEERILITMCPISNLELRCVKDIKELPIREYLDAKVPFSINSDDPAYFGGYVQENYCAVQDAFNLNAEEWARIVTDAITLSWCKETRKDEMLQSLSKMLGRYA